MDSDSLLGFIVELRSQALQRSRQLALYGANGATHDVGDVGVRQIRVEPEYENSALPWAEARQQRGDLWGELDALERRFASLLRRRCGQELAPHPPPRLTFSRTIVRAAYPAGY